MTTLNPKYDHIAVEDKKYEFWLENGFFESGDLSKKPFTIVIPPPNVTGKLHLGHTWDTTLQDMIIRRKRMQGFDALYLPGMDHAGIATQAKVDQKLRLEGINRYELGREKYLEVAWKWKEEYANHIRDQWKTIGLSLDYKKERFTLDEGLSDSVNHVFIKLYEKGYIYRGERIINWDVEAKTALSNIEIEHKDVNGALYYYTYPFVDQVGGLTVASTRPETMFGDSALMVHPLDSRFLAYHGKEVYIPTTKIKIKVITDDYVDRDFGTGIVKVTPAHDPNDFQVGRRHDLEMPLCMNEDGTMNHRAFQYENMDRFECRKQVVSDLQKLGLMVKIEPIVHSVGHSERTGVIVEPRLSKQWFVKMEELAKNAVNQSEVSFVPDRFQKIFLHWMNSIEDWCISRQLWWGHRIPVWYKNEEIYCSKTPPTEDGWTQDEDVLDTWFSSALWPFSTLGWPNNTEEFKRYYPTDVLVTGYDIIFFWVARMIFQAIEFTEESPFKECLIHGLIRDEFGVKMSKSLGNGVDPIDVVNEYGADALRYFISTNSAPGLDLRYDKEKMESSWNYINKLWNISRYVLMNTENMKFEDIILKQRDMNFADKWILTRLNQTIDQVDHYFETYEFGEAAKLIYNFTWNDFASWYVEMTKINQDIDQTKSVLLYVLEAIIKLLHPFMPFVTEEIFQMMPHIEPSIMISPWPRNNDLIFEETLDKEWFFEMIKRIRTVRNDYSVSWTKPIDLLIKVDFQSMSDFLNQNLHYLNKFLNPKSVEISLTLAPIEKAIAIILPNCTIYVPLGSLVDLTEEIIKLEKELIVLESEMQRSAFMLSNETFLKKAPLQKVQDEILKSENYQKNYEEMKRRLEELKG
ncbi:MAG: valine--tRNA ligase [Firmicutes bacterium]|nr:valine--tRNA ligase [Bacillota bacterium]